ncbi:unnamed protein product [Urochloa humidicola]
MASNLAKPAEVDASNIQRPKVEETSAEDQKVLEEIRKKIRDKKEQEMRELEDEAVKQYLSHFSVDRHKKVQKDKDVVINVPQIEVKSDASPDVNSDIANMIDGAVSATVNNKFAAMSDRFESIINTRLEQIEVKFGTQFSSNDVNASTSNAEKLKDSALGDLSNLHILKTPGVPANHIQSRTVIGNSASGGSSTAATNAMVPHAVVYSEPPVGVSSGNTNSSLQHIPSTLPSTYT